MTSTPSISPAGYALGETVTYRITVTNNGVASANNVQLTETLDAPLEIIPPILTPSQGSCSGTDCNLGTIAPGQAPVTIDVPVTLPGFDSYPSDQRTVEISSCVRLSVTSCSRVYSSAQSSASFVGCGCSRTWLGDSTMARARQPARIWGATSANRPAGSDGSDRLEL